MDFPKISRHPPIGWENQPTPQDEIEASLFAEPIPGSRYIQVGAVDRGVAVILTEGLRTRGFNGFIAQGPSAGIYRVLVGPFHNIPDYQAAKDAVDRMGVASFPRLYVSPPPAGSRPPVTIPSSSEVR